MKKQFACLLLILTLCFCGCSNLRKSSPTNKDEPLNSSKTAPTTQSYSHAILTKDCKKYLKQFYEIEIPRKSDVMYFSNESNFVAKIALSEDEFDLFLNELQNKWIHSELLYNKINHLSTLYKNWDLKEEDVFEHYYKFYTATMPNGAKCSREKGVYISKPTQGVYYCYFVK